MKGEDSASAKCPFLDMPPELRNRIYHLALVHDGVVHVGRDSESLVKEHSLLATCTRVRSEATGIYYAVNTFRTTDIMFAEDWLKQLDERKLKAIKALRAFHPNVTRSFSEWSPWRDRLQSIAKRIAANAGKGLLAEDAMRVPLKISCGRLAWTTAAGLDMFEAFRAPCPDHPGWRFKFRDAEKT